MPGRKYTAQSYRYGFNGQEHDDELFASANTAEYWMYDARLGRRWERDPIRHPWQSPYVSFADNPIALSDPLGLDEKNQQDANQKKAKDGDTYTDNGGRKFEFNQSMNEWYEVNTTESKTETPNNAVQPAPDDQKQMLAINTYGSI